MHGAPRAARKLAGSASIASRLIGQSKVAYLPPAKLAERRDRNVRSIVRYAAATVPFYRDWFRTHGVDPREIVGAADLARLPIIDKATLQADQQRLVSESREARAAFAIQTSGSSGVPVTIYQGSGILFENAATGVRERQVRAEALGPDVPARIVSVGYPGNATQTVRAQLRERAFVTGSETRHTLSLFEPLEQLIAEINRLRPTLLIAYGSLIELLFGTVKARGLELHPPRAVLYVSDHLTEIGRRVVEDDFGVKVLSNYSAVEALRIGFGCLESPGYHQHSDLTHVRIVDDAGNNVPAGQTGEIVISNLVNRGTVLLNYRLGDQGSLAAEPGCGCGCGRTLPRLATLEGRRDDVIELASGRHVHSAEIWSLVRSNPELIQYQLVQLTHERFEFRVVATDEAMFDRVATDLLERLRPLLGSAEVTSTYVDAFEPYGSMKRRQVVSYVTRPDQPRL